MKACRLPVGRQFASIRVFCLHRSGNAIFSPNKKLTPPCSGNVYISMVTACKCGRDTCQEVVGADWAEGDMLVDLDIQSGGPFADG